MTHLNRLSTDDWMADNEMGHGFDMMVFDQGTDYSGPVRCSVVRKRSSTPSKKGFLYIHGFSDYFFQKEMAELFARHGYNFYAVDLRKYGRSILPGQRPFEVRDLREYFDDIRAGLAAMHSDGIEEVILMGHSTGGLTSALYMQTDPDPRIKGLILNSPFLAWNIPGIKGAVALPVVRALGRFAPSITVRNSPDESYSHSISAEHGGEWFYRKDWKPDRLPDVDSAWIRAIDIAQKALRRGRISVPVLLLHSDKSAYPGDSHEAFANSDGVLNVKAISKAGQKIGHDVTDITIHNALHDIILSRPDVRAVAFTAIFDWLGARNL
ncbi:MAG: alpha/beta hydrolase [Paramuribaculum sp.]|nr:alpha/beta hydrolase [Paramuribaculum sp.]